MDSRFGGVYYFSRCQLHLDGVFYCPGGFLLAGRCYSSVRSEPSGKEQRDNTANAFFFRQTQTLEGAMLGRFQFDATESREYSDGVQVHVAMINHWSGAIVNRRGRGISYLDWASGLWTGLSDGRAGRPWRSSGRRATAVITRWDRVTNGGGAAGATPCRSK